MGPFKWVFAIIGVGMAVHAQAASFSIRPINIVSGSDFSITATGTLGTIDNTSDINDWNLTVTTRERLAHYSQANTANFSSGEIASDGLQLTVATSPDGVQDGGALFFRSPNVFQDFGVALADFTSAATVGGQAFYLAGSAFDFLDLNQLPASTYVAAHANATAKNVFDLTPLTFANGVTLSGTLTTNGSLGVLGASSIVAWDINVDMKTEDVFNPTNSGRLSDQVVLGANGQDLLINNPDGFLTFSKGSAGGHPFALQIADFSSQSPPGGQAGYFQGRLAVNTLDLGAPVGSWRITGIDPVTAPVPEPVPAFLLITGVTGLVALRNRLARGALKWRRLGFLRFGGNARRA